jgi:hypothetical protein
MQTTSPSNSSITEGEDDPCDSGFNGALAIIINLIFCPRTTIPFPLTATSVWSDAWTCSLVLQPFLKMT